MKTAVITGISSGIGQAIATRLKREGWKVVGLPHGELDLNDLAAVAQKGEELVQDYPIIDALIHVAGIWHDDERPYAGIDLEDFTPEQIAETMNVGLTGFMVLAAKLLPVLAKDGCVIGISGTFENGASGWLPYYTAKRGLEDFLVGLSQDYPHGPRVYGISPSDTETPPYARFFPEDAAAGQPAEVVADALVKVVLGEASYETGSMIKVKNGVASKEFHA